jgi:hypothetical protein
MHIMSISPSEALATKLPQGSVTQHSPDPCECLVVLEHLYNRTRTPIAVNAVQWGRGRLGQPGE